MTPDQTRELVQADTALAARPSPTGEKVTDDVPPHAIETRNDAAGFVEFINADVPYIVRDIHGPTAILLDVETRAVIGYRVYDGDSPFVGPTGEKVEAVACNPLEGYADSYAQMSRDRDGRVQARSVERDIRQNMMPIIAALVAERDEARRYAEQLAVSLAAKHYPDVPQWKPLSGDLWGMLSQIDNMTTGMCRSDALATANARVERLEIGITKALRLHWDDDVENVRDEMVTLLNSAMMETRPALTGGENDS